MGNAIISFEGVSKHFGQVTAVNDTTFDIQRGEFFSLLGPSGCGKTTLLRMVAGFEIPTTGEIMIDGQPMSATPPNQRPVNMVFQNYAIFPHLDVRGNIAFGMRKALQARHLRGMEVGCGAQRQCVWLPYPHHIGARRERRTHAPCAT